MGRTVRLVCTAIVVVAAVAATLVMLTRGAEPAPTPAAEGDAAGLLVREESHRLSTAADNKVTVVEFLDFECEGCRAAYPSVEELRRDYAGRVTFVMRYFPLSSHRNAELAARAVEAAGRQGQLEPMYKMMFDNQAGWGEQQNSQRDVFVGFATELGLDIDRFNRDLDDPAVAERVLRDRTDGLNLGVNGTPTFFVNGLPVRANHDRLVSAIEQELSR